MCSNLSCYQLETGNYFYRILYVNFTVTTRKKFIVNTKKKIKTESKHTTKEYHQNTRKERKRRNKQRGTTKTPRKQQNGNKYLTIINNYFKCQWTKFINQKT